MARTQFLIQSKTGSMPCVDTVPDSIENSAEQFIFDRDRNVAHAHYMVEQEVIHEEEESGEGSTQESHDTARPALSEIDEVPEHLMKKVILRHNFSIEEALNELLNQQGKGWRYRFGDGI
ncbi:hypothetical protein DPMN_092636 [Dreissena polymorpha]|uniref:Uncharacterized protein n=1 Tax=Dreissena polymorpha TaxID=45954 RepID=A0A9D4R0D3_DREPO|nr:hypothetical protein DPMN_092636 [Dreissena polymorpha]